MNFCPEIAVLQSALGLLQRELKIKEPCSVGKKEATVHVPNLCSVIQEICSGLEEDNTRDQQMQWQQLIHNLLLYKTIVTEYEQPSDDKEEETTLDKMEMTSRIIPAIGKAIYFEVVKRCNWFNFFIHSLDAVKPQFSSNLILDAVKYISTNDLDKMDMTFNRVLMDYIIGDIISTGNLSSLQVDQSRADTAAHPLMESSVTSSGINLSDAQRQSYSMDCETNSDNSGNKFDQLFQMLLKARVDYVTNVSASDQFIYLADDQWYCEFCQLLFLGALGSSRSSTDIAMLSNWLRLNVYSKTTSNIIYETKPNSFGKLTHTEGMLVNNLDLNAKTLQCYLSQYPWQLWCELLQFLADSRQMENCREMANEKIVCNQTVQLSSLVKPVTITKMPKKDIGPFMVVECDGLNLIQMCKQCLETHLQRERNGCGGEQDVMNFDGIIIFLDNMIKNSEIQDKEKLEWSLSAVLWRIDQKQPGYQDMLQKLLTVTETSIWSNEMLLEVLRRHIEVLSHPETLLQMYRLVADFFALGNIDNCASLKQLVLDGFCRLPVSLQDKHIAHVYMVYRYWPAYQDGFSSHVTHVLNKLTLEKSEQVMGEVSQLSLQNVEAVLKGIINRAFSSPEQTDIAIQVLCRIVTVVTSSTEEVNLCNAIHEILVTKELSSKEQQNILRMVDSVVKPLKLSSNLSSTTLLNPAEFVAKSVLPFISVPCDNNQPISASFALDLFTGVLNSLKEHDLLLERTIKVIATSSTPWLLCLAEVLQYGVVLFDDECFTDKVQLRESVDDWFKMLRTLRKITNVELQVDEWLVSSLDNMDWTVKIQLSEILQPNCYPKACEDFSTDLIKHTAGDLSLNLLRAVAISDVMLQSIVHACLNKGGVTLDYHSILVAFVQLMPNLLVPELKRCLMFVQQIMGAGLLEVQYCTESCRSLPLVNLAELEQPLCLSMLMRDMICLIQHGSGAANMNYLTHCMRLYSAVLKDCILDMSSSCVPEEQMFLVSEVFGHICAATWWLPLATLDAINVILLDIVCSFDNQRSELKSRRLQSAYNGCLDFISDCLKFVKSQDTKNMTQKKIRDLLKI